MPSALGTVANDQQRWSLTANQLKQSLVRWRMTVLILAVVGAVFGTLAAHTEAPVIGYVGAAAMAIIAVIQQARLGQERTHAWIIARAASEALKREMFLYRARAGTYSGARPLDVLIDRRDAIIGSAKAAEEFTVDPPREVEPPPDTIEAEAYLAERVNDQIKWFRGKATTFAGAQRRFGSIEFGLAVAAAILGVVLTNTGANEGWLAVITTIVAAVGSHVQAQRYSQLVVTYRATASRLESIRDRCRTAGATLAKLVELCEAALQEENQGWIVGLSAAKVTEPGAHGDPA